MNADPFPSPFYTVARVLLIAVLMPAGLHAQTAMQPAHVRFWKTDLHAAGMVKLSLKSTGGRRSTLRELVSAGPGYVFDNYLDAPMGRWSLEIYTSADSKHPLASLPAEFTSGAFYTVLLRDPAQTGSPPRLEVIEDSAVTVDPATAQITVRNFVVNLTDVKVTVGDNVNAQFPAGEGYMQMHGIKPAVYPVITVGNGPDGKPFEWNTESDLRQYHHQTLLIYPDPYGRIRPRLCVDGEAQMNTADDKRGQH